LLCLLGAWIARGAAVFKVADDPTIPQNTDFYQYTFVRFEPFALYASAVFFSVFILFYVDIGRLPQNCPGFSTGKAFPCWLRSGC
jgi:hypothetical protein